VFRDFFNRDDDPDINRHVPEAARWTRRDLRAGAAPIGAALSTTSLALTATSPSAVAFVQGEPSPARGVVRYSTRVSVMSGEGSRSGSGVHEAGLLLLGDRAVADTAATFVGLSIDGDRGGVTVRVGDGAGGYLAAVTIAAARLPFEVAAGEHEIEVDHDVVGRVLRRIAVNGIDVTPLVPPEARRQRVERGLFGLRAAMEPVSARQRLQQFYWVYRVECVREPGRGTAC
jgi:hypothetical protein